MKNAHNMFIATMAILLMLACGTVTTQPPVSNQVETIVAATLQSLPINIPTDTPGNMPTEPPTNAPPEIPTNTSTSIPTGTPTNTFTPTTVALVVVNVRKLPPPPTPTRDPDGLGFIPSGDYIYIEHVEMTSCNVSTLCRSFSSLNNPNYNLSSDICVLWVEGGYRVEDPEISVGIYQNNQLLASGNFSVIGDRVCRIVDIPLLVPGDYLTKLVFGNEEFNLPWSIR